MCRATQSGFSLIELLIAVAIVGILAAVAIPSYRAQIQESRRSAGQTALLEAAQLAERQFTTTNAYTGTDISGVDVEFYTLTLPTLTATTYTVSAAPTGPQATDPCGTMTVTHTGARTAGATDCWD
ncbi:methylation site containing protein [Luminiphilus syltensis NOR5-1B]|uniref:Methylation site containing protein n=1 Tax=Luminiphilus syltensis NOR5-1B TaxID=565045 RepID=B8KUV3_9GAMM|nr:type IV pilin protein [Luminiphilus syltensis]EED35040.1 methylation site containing protein [Luminiphilus syltensis NOR5-1B]